MVSICFRSHVAAALLLACIGCGREDVELFPGSRVLLDPSSPNPPVANPNPPDPPVTNPPVTNPPVTNPPVTNPPVTNPPPPGDSNPPTAEQCAAKVPATLLMPVPVMGWNGWNSFGCSKKLDAQKVQDIANVLVSSGMQAAGYRYVNLDDCWELSRGALGEIVLDPSKLPNGMQDLSSTLHAQGFKLGVFRRAGDCTGVPAGHYAEDVATYGSWQIDLLKLVSCHLGDYDQADIENMAGALLDGGRPVVLSLASPPLAEWMPDIAHMIRSADTIQASWASVLTVLDTTAPLAAYVRPGMFNDPDMLEVGNSPLTDSEARAHFSLWSILSAPLLAGNDLTTQSPAIRDILTNRDVLALDQDPLALQGVLIRNQTDLQIYAKPLSACGARGVVLFNRGEVAVTATLNWSEIWLEPGSASVSDLWAATELGPIADQLTLSVPPHDVRALKIVGNELPNLHGEVPLGDAPWTYATNGFGPVERNSSNGELLAGDGIPMRIRGKSFAGGLGVHAPSLIRFRLGGLCSRFTAQVGIDDEKNHSGTANFQVWADGERLWGSGPISGVTPPVLVDVSVVGRNDLRLFVGTSGDGNTGDHADWADARLICDPAP